MVIMGSQSPADAVEAFIREHASLESYDEMTELIESCEAEVRPTLYELLDQTCEESLCIL